MEARSELAHHTAPPTLVSRQRSITCAALVGLVSLALGLAAHAVSGGALPSPPIVVALAALAVLVATLVSRLRLPGWGVMLMLGAAQQVLHWLLGGLGGAGSSSFFGSSPGHHAEGLPVGAGTPSGHSPEVMLMLHTHLAVALLVGWVVVRHSAITASLGRTLRRR